MPGRSRAGNARHRMGAGLHGEPRQLSLGQAEIRNPKSKSRKLKEVRSPKPEGPSTTPVAAIVSEGIMSASPFGVRVSFEFRPSAFGLRSRPGRGGCATTASVVACAVLSAGRDIHHRLHLLGLRMVVACIEAVCGTPNEASLVKWPLPHSRRGASGPRRRSLERTRRSVFS